ncbi:hypothetical protein DYU05_00240 [Mucilaginibacter terrenus]|uniref:Uncharacterized protein n=1 Tax=Mucilaginibacter terrenus TaxID=2482727 RepID=A0A3E2NSY3_9SPHI|nr:hypothetical protein [Mucilaginibacter terrenus]RFZ84104.1 hypothetical protein DYU05_00240 [Mucilaginibacter terrenus]
MLYVLVFAAVLLFVLHVVFLLISFKNGALLTRRYFYSHLTLWLTGGCVFLLALFYSGHGISGFLDYFNTAIKLGMILLFTFALSLVAHLIVSRIVLPLMRK